MTRLMQKEFRTLALPAGLVLATALAGAWGASSHSLFPGQVRMSVQLALLAFYLGTPLIAALSFGAEFHHGTMVLLLTEPVSRARVWLEKWVVVVAVVAVLAAVELVFLKNRGPGDGSTAVAVMFIAMAVCSAPLWTLVARSTIGGLVFSLSAVMMLELASNYVAYRMTGIQRHEVFQYTPALTAVRVAYSVVTLGLGWRVFSRFQAVGAGLGGASASDTRAAGWTILRPRPGDPIGNLVRNELMLQRPTFMAAAAFVACWLIALGVIAMPSRPATLAKVLPPLLLSIYMPLVVALAGMISACEDASLGIKAWHLTLPMSARMQWAVKLVVALVVGVLLATALPALMLTVADLDFSGPRPGAFLQPSFLWFVAGAVVLTFWASTLLGDTVKAATAAGGVVLAMGFGTSYVINWAMTAGRHAEWLVRLVGLLHVSQRNGDGIVQLALDVFVTAVGLTALWQSRSAYSRLRTSSATFLRLALVLLVVAFVAAFCLGVFLTALELSFRRAQPVVNSIQLRQSGAVKGACVGQQACPRGSARAGKREFLPRGHSVLGDDPGAGLSPRQFDYGVVASHTAMPSFITNFVP